MMDALGVARHLGADDARRIGLVLGAMDAADARAVDDLDIERADRRAVMRTDGGAALNLRLSVHAGQNSWHVWPRLMKKPQTRACGFLGRRRKRQPTISLPENHWAISIAAVSGASEPCTEFSPMLRAKSLRMVPASAFSGLVAPITSR